MEKPLAISRKVYYNKRTNFFKSYRRSAMIKTIAKPADKKVTGCGECRSTCQSACKTSCTVGNQNCEKIEKEARINKAK